MRSILYMLVVAVLLGGCSNSDSMTEAAPSVANPGEHSGLTKEEQLAAIAERYKLDRPEEDTIMNDFPFAASEVRFDGKSIEDQLEAVVNELFGEPAETKSGEWLQLSGTKTPYIHNVYVTDIGQIDVMFIDGKATRIALKPKEE
ncbi:hypothetical protein EDM58_05100 [Brevibacillus panacihumi]|uniref:DUF4309 domain-containing protein n=2 Tax=Brevibacillus panacihumi TaxID=497735 RepID=A0A3M8D620_9BACL|nr:hypothetical protein EDM58_05100 [Brevibacillus panacihumi]